MTTPAGVESVVARCLLDADFLGEIMTDPMGALSGYELDERARSDFDALDFSRVRNFAGFITKVQHNYLWRTTPYTRALLKLYGIEVEVFATYHARHLELRARQASREEKIVSFTDFLCAYASNTAYPGLRDVALHEHICWDLESAPELDRLPQPCGDRAQTVPPRQASQPGGLVPQVRGALRVAFFTFSPLETIEQLSADSFDPGCLAPCPAPLVYWVEPETRRLRIMQTDALTAAILAAADGDTPINAIVRGLSDRLATPDAVRRILPVVQAAADRGLLQLLNPDGG